MSGTWWGRTEGRVLSGVLWVGLAAVGVLGVAAPVARIAGLAGREVRIPVALEEAAAVPAAAAHGRVALEGAREGELVVADPTVAERVLAEAPTLLAALSAVAVLLLLLRIAAAFRKGDAFAPGNAGRLAAVALLVGIGTLVVPPVRALAADRLAAPAPEVEAAVVTGFSVPMAPLLAAVLIAALAEAFRYGARLREDTEGLV
ncbi:DUF2975 domain-containing protein [Nocardiopsis sp. RSe5-2]|uniref:DUF2975 domain-containing protein n=1 Tax=Nocardiopsis endophytica TaxID=3018445 RepID=A0ABT4U8Y2_9ACTN|nr:DUF2975 domain-containing protein [Nocardiopsis endophytica]MDA2813406.1 DUF2975 domain-containing protein [Nocardiopsis endophytica]